jgi:thiol:disulfide interchange protein DsbD
MLKGFRYSCVEPAVPAHDSFRRPTAVVSLAFLLVALAPTAAAAAVTAGSDTTAFQRALAQGTFAALAASYAVGLATSLTPCVYPMIAITVSVFGAREAKSRLQGTLLSLAFVIGIVCLFAPLGVASALMGRGFGSALGDPRVAAGIAVVFLALSASLFGAFEMALPSALNNRLATVGGGGFGGAFLLGLVCGLVAAPCVGPFLFSLLGWIATTRNVALGSAAMTSYALGLGTLFFLVGAFAVNLPKAGAWMMGVKWLGGVALAYLALGYVRDAIPARFTAGVHAGASGVGAFAVALLAIGVALGGFHVAAERRRSPFARWSKTAKLASIAPAVLGLLLVTTYWQARETGEQRLAWETNEARAVERAASEHRPVVIDFGAAWCSACRELERVTFPSPRVVAESARFVALHIDATNEDDPEVARVRQKYRATEGLPVVVLLASDGREAARFTEFVPPDRFAAALRLVP